MNYTTIRCGRLINFRIGPKATRNISLVVAPLVAVAVFFLLSHRVEASSKFWIGATAGNLNDDTRWSLSSGGPNNTTAPGAADIVNFDGNGIGNCTITTNVTLQGMNIGSGYPVDPTMNTGTITVAAGVNFTLAPFSSFQMDGGTFNASDATFSMNAGEFIGSFIQNGGIFNGNGTIDINCGIARFDGGTFNATSGNTTFHRSFFRNGGTFNPNNGTVIFTASPGGGINLASPPTQTFKNLTLNNTGDNFSLTGTAVVMGTLRLVSGLTNSGTFQAQGNVVVENTFGFGSPLTGGNSSITFNGTSDQTFANNGGSNPTGTWTINKSAGALILATNMNVGTSQLNLTDGTINTTFASGPSLEMKEGPTSLSVNGNMLDTQGSTVNIAATLDGGSAILAFTGTGARTVTMPVGVVMPNVLLNAANATLTTSGMGTVTMGNLEVQAGTANLSAITADTNGSFTQSGGTFTAPAANLFLAGNFTHGAGGTFNHNNGTFVFDGPTAQIVDLNGTETFGSVTLNKTGMNNNDVLNIAVGDTLIAANALDLQNGEVWGGTIQVPNAMTVAATFADGGDDGGTGTIAIIGAAARTITIPIGTELPNIIFNAPNVTLAGSGLATQDFRTRDFTLQAGSISLNVSLHVRDFILTGGTFNLTNSLHLEGNFTHTAGGTFNHISGAVNPRAANTVFDVNGTETFFRLSFAIGGTTVNLSGDTLIVVDSLNLGGTIVNNGFIDAQKSVTLGGFGGGGNATVNIVGSATRTITVPGGVGLPNFVLNAANVTMTGGTASTSYATFSSMNLQAGTIQPGNIPWRFSQSFTQSGGAFASGAKDIDFDGDFTLTGNTATFTTSQANTFFGGNFTDATPAGFSGTPGTVTFDGSSTQNIDVGVLEIFSVLDIAPADGVGINITSGQQLIADLLTLTNGQVNTGTLQTSAFGALSVANGFDGGTANVRISSGTYTNNGGVNPTGTWTFTSGTLTSDLDLSNGTAALVLQSGGVFTGTHTLNAGERTITRTSGFVNGNLQRSFATTGTKTFDLGVFISSTPVYLPVTVDVTALVVSPSSLKIGTTTGTHPSLDPLTSLNRYWTITESGDLTATLTFRYLDPNDINGNESIYRIFRITSGMPVNFPNSCPASPCVDTIANTATIAGVTQFSDWSLGEPGSPTSVELIDFNAAAYANGTMLQWQTGFEADNLGFNLYREQDGERVLINRQLIAGAALRADSTLRAGDRYTWWDVATNTNAVYWLEDTDLRGQSTWHGPFYINRVGGKPPSRPSAALLSEIARNPVQQDVDRTVERTAPATTVSSQQKAQQASLASQPAAKIGIRREGWYQVTQTELASIGFNVKCDPRLLQLFVDGRELPVVVRGGDDGSFDPTDAVEFYGIGTDSPFTDSRTYWLTSGENPGLRIGQEKGEGAPSSSQGFMATIERRDRTIYFSALRNGERENFFGAVIAGNPLDQALNLSNTAAPDWRNAAIEVALEVALQGVTLAQHRVDVELNGVQTGSLEFSDQSQTFTKFELPVSIVREGTNTVRLTPRGGPGDVSLVDFIRITYPHRYTAEDNSLKLTAPGNQQTTINGFTSDRVRIIDVTEADSPLEIIGAVDKRQDGYAVTFTPTESGERSLLVFTAEKPPASVLMNTPSNLTSGAANMVIIAPGEFIESVEPLVALRRAQGLSVELIDIEDIYDEFSFGQKTPFALRDFLGYAKSNWLKKPGFVLFAGDASYDPKNHLGFGNSDLVPTKLVDTAYMETASDDWLADFNGDGIAEIAVGRLPGRTIEAISAMVSKTIEYEQLGPADEALLVADANQGFDFEHASAELSALIPRSLRITQVNRGRLDPEVARRSLFEGLHRKQFLVNYVGHGSVNQWRGNLLTNTDALALRNEHLPMFVMMTCLNGYFHDPAADSIGESLLKAERGGAVAVWASSGMTLPTDQAMLNNALYRLLFDRGAPLTIGEAAIRAKASVSDPDVRRTWILLGDPVTRLR